MQEPSLIGYRDESLLGKKMILRSTSLFREKKIRKLLFCSEKLCSEKGFVFKIFEPPSELVFEEFNVEAGDALSGFRATLFFSESLKSQGIKEVRVVWADGAWKIAEEKFYAEKIKVTGLHNSVRRKNIIP
jgi:hypothetical protein